MRRCSLAASWLSQAQFNKRANGPNARQVTILRGILVQSEQIRSVCQYLHARGPIILRGILVQSEQIRPVCQYLNARGLIILCGILVQSEQIRSVCQYLNARGLIILRGILVQSEQIRSVCQYPNARGLIILRGILVQSEQIRTVCQYLNAHGIIILRGILVQSEQIRPVCQQLTARVPNTLCTIHVLIHHVSIVFQMSKYTTDSRTYTMRMKVPSQHQMTYTITEHLTDSIKGNRDRILRHNNGVSGIFFFFFKTGGRQAH